MAEHPNDHLVIYGNSQGAGIANVEKRKLAEQYPEGTTRPISTSCWAVTPTCPTAALMARFPGLYIPILNLTFNGPAATDTQFDTVEINQQYDGFTDFPLYPLNFVADLNAVLGIFYVHMYPSTQPGRRSATSPAYPGPPRRHRLLLLRDPGSAVVRSATHPGGARAGDRCVRAVLPGDRGTGL